MYKHILLRVISTINNMAPTFIITVINIEVWNVYILIKICFNKFYTAIINMVQFKPPLNDLKFYLAFVSSEIAQKDNFKKFVVFKTATIL